MLILSCRARSQGPGGEEHVETCLPLEDQKMPLSCCISVYLTPWKKFNTLKAIPFVPNPHKYLAVYGPVCGERKKLPISNGFGALKKIWFRWLLVVIRFHHTDILLCPCWKKHPISYCLCWGLGFSWPGIWKITWYLWWLHLLLWLLVSKYRALVRPELKHVQHTINTSTSFIYRIPFLSKSATLRTFDVNRDNYVLIKILSAILFFRTGIV